MISNSISVADMCMGVVRGISFGLFGKAEEFIQEARGLNAKVVRAYLYWSQIEPSPGSYSWITADALLDQFDGEEEVWITLCSSSMWATRVSTDFLPASPANDLASYGEFVRRTVERYAGRVKYWQCENEPSNVGLLWAGAAEEYISHLTEFHRAVRAADPDAFVVLGGCGYDFFSSEAGGAPRLFFEHLAMAGRDIFDLFDVHLYGDPYNIPTYVEQVRRLMQGCGYEKPILAGEYSGPSLFEFPEAEGAMQKELSHLFSAPPAALSKEELGRAVREDSAERRAMRGLYARMQHLPPKLQMFMVGCPADLESKRHRIACRQLVMRNILAISCGVSRTLYWNLAPEVPGPADAYQIMHLLIGKYPLLDYRVGKLDYRQPEADTFELLARSLAGISTLTRLQIEGEGTIFAFVMEREHREPILILWDQRDAFDGEHAPPIEVKIPWSAGRADAVDVFGKALPVRVFARSLQMSVSDTPVLISAGSIRDLERSTEIRWQNTFERRLESEDSTYWESGNTQCKRLNARRR